MEIPTPPIPAEIVTEILSHLGKNDLLKCRLVSQSWNGLSLKILRNPKYGHEHELTEDNIQKFIEFCDGRSGEWVLPLHLIKVCQNLQIPNSIPFIQQLQTIFGEKCVNSLTLRHNSSSSLKSVEELISILTLTAPSLTHLDLSNFIIQYRGQEKTKVKEMLGETQLNFPNLSKFKSCPPPPTNLREGEQENTILSFLIAKSKNLKELQVFSLSDLLVIQKQIGSLRKLKVVRPFAFKGLDVDKILELIRNGTDPVLRDLSVIYDTTYGPQLDHRILYEFLTSFSTSLQSLTIERQGTGQAIPRILKNPLPNLSHLRLLRIQTTLPKGFGPDPARYGVDPEKLNLNSQAFPVLESMDIPTNVYFESTLGDSGNCKDGWILRTVKNLKIRVMDSPFNGDEMDQNGDLDDEEIISRASAKDYVDHLQELFPNVTSLTLVNESDGHEEYLNQLLIAFIQSEGAPRFKNFEIEDCAKNYLGHILNGLDDPDKQPLVIIKNMSMDAELLKSIKKAFQVFSGGSELKVVNQLEFIDGAESRVMTCNSYRPTNILLKMTGVEKIKIQTNYSTKLNDDSGQLGIEPESNKKDLFLMSLPKHLPLLRQIDISQRMFGYDKEFCKQQIVNVQGKFPNLIINTTH